MKQQLKLLGTLLAAVLLGACGLLTENAEAPTTTTVQETTQAPRVEVKADGTYTVKEYTFVSNGKKICQSVHSRRPRTSSFSRL